MAVPVVEGTMAVYGGGNHGCTCAEVTMIVPVMEGTMVVPMVERTMVVLFLR